MNDDKKVVGYIRVGKEEQRMSDTVYVVIDLFKLEVEVVGASIDSATAHMIAASAPEGHNRFVEVYENGIKVGEGGFRE